MEITRDKLIGIKYTHKHNKPRLDSVMDWLGLNTCTRCNVIQRSGDLFWDSDYDFATNWGALCVDCANEVQS